MQDIVSALEDEIQFWKRLISEWKPDRQCPEYQRMQDALALAEYKLDKYKLAGSPPAETDMHAGQFN